MNMPINVIANAKQIKYVVDSAHGNKKYTYVLSKKIISPYEFLKQIVVFLLLCCQAYFLMKLKNF